MAVTVDGRVIVLILALSANAFGPIDVIEYFFPAISKNRTSVPIGFISYVFPAYSKLTLAGFPVGNETTVGVNGNT